MVRAGGSGSVIPLVRQLSEQAVVGGCGVTVLRDPVPGKRFSGIK